MLLQTPLNVVKGPSLSINNDIAIFNGTTGKLIKDSGISISTISNSFIQNGNSFGLAARLGTNDNFALEFETNNVKAGSIDTSGNLTLDNGNLILNGSGATIKLASFAGTNVLVLDGSGNITTANPTTTEINYVVGVTSPIQTQINNINSGLSWKLAVRVATTANITLSGTQTIDGIAIIAGDRVLVKNQTIGANNGIYVCSSGAWSRSTDATTGGSGSTGILGATAIVEEGTISADFIYTCSTDAPITIGVTTLTFIKTSATTYTNGTGLTLTGNIFAIDSTVATLTGSQTLTNKVINGSNNTITNVSLTAGITGILPIANGGRNNTTGVTNGIDYYDGTKFTTLSTFVFDGINLGIGAIPDSLLTVSKQTTIVAPPSGTSVHFIGLDANFLRITLDTHNNTSAGGTAFLGRRSRGTAGTPLAVNSGDTILTVNATGYGTTAYAAASTGLITLKANQLFTDSAMGTYFTVFTTPDGSVTAAEALRVTGAGEINAFQAGGVYQVNGTTVISATALGSGIISSSLTSVGTIATGTWSSTIITKDTVFTLQDDGDITKLLKFQLSGITTATTRTLIIPDANTTIVGTDATQTLTNKTLALIGGSNTFSGFTAGSVLYHDGTTIAQSNANFSFNSTSNVLTLSSSTTSIGTINATNASTNGWAADFIINPTNSSSIREVIRLHRQTSGTATIGYAGSIGMYINNSSGAEASGARIDWVGTNVTAGAEQTDLNIYTRTGGAGLVKNFILDGIGNFKLNTAGGGLYVKEGTNATMGVATLILGTSTVSTTKVTASSRIHLTVQSLGTVAVATPIAVTARSAGTSFTITSSSATDTSVIAWIIIEPS